MLQSANWPSVGGKPLSGDDMRPPLEMESDLVTLTIWPRLQCKIKCISFAFTKLPLHTPRKKNVPKCSSWLFRNITVVKSVALVIAVPSVNFILVNCLPMPCLSVLLCKKMWIIVLFIEKSMYPNSHKI